MTTILVAKSPISEDISQNSLTKIVSENKCKFCGKLYSSPASLRTHEKWHTGDLKHKCSFCEKKFRNPSEVKRHEMTHTGEKPNKCPHCKMKFIQKTSLKDHIEKKHKTVSNMENSESADLDLLELKDFSLQEYLNQSYEKVESLSETDVKTEQIESVPSTSIFSENFKVVTETIPNNNNSVPLEQKVTLSLQPQPFQSAKQFELLSVVDNDNSLSNELSPGKSSAQSNGANETVAASNQLFDIKEEKLDDISIFFEELEGQYPHLRTVDTDGVVIKEEKPVIQTPSHIQTVSFQPGNINLPCPPKYSEVANTVNIHVSALTPTPSNPPPSYQEAVTLSSSDAQSFHLVPSSNSTIGTNGTNKTPIISMPMGNTTQSQNTPEFSFVSQQPSSTATATVSLTFQDELNEFCEGILNQIESSDWNGINLEESHSIGGGFTVVNPPPLLDDSSISQLSQSSLMSDESSNLSLASNSMMMKMDPETPPVDVNDPSWVSGRASLPSGWKMRIVDTNVGSRQIKKSHFLAPTGHYFDSRKSAIDHMIRTHSYSEDDIETMKKGLREKTKFDWSSSREDIPRGWKTREKLSSDGKTRIFYLSPGGISFPCRLAAYEHMVKDGGYTIADIELMKIGAKNKRNKAKDFREGDPSLPAKWKIRINAQNKESFRSPLGVFFHSRQTVLDHLIQIGAPKDDIERVRSKLPVGKKARRKKPNTEFKWTEGDPSCPAGWKIRVVNCADGHSVTFFLTPEGITIKGRKAALQHMLKTGLYSPQDVDLMKNHLNVISKVSDIWSSGDPTLPVGWKIKKYKSKSDSTRVHCEYLSPHNQVFRSRKAVVEHMRKVGGYTEHDVKIVEAGNVKFKQKTVQENIVTGVGTSWTESDTLPGGWRLKEEGEGAQKKTVYLSPEGKVFWTRYQVLEAVIKSGGSQEDIAKVQRGINPVNLQGPEISKPTFSSPNNPSISSNVSQPSCSLTASSPILTKAFTQSSNYNLTITPAPASPASSSSSPRSSNYPTLNSIIVTSQQPQQSLKILEEKTVPTLRITTGTNKTFPSTGKPTILESKQKPARGSEIVWKVCVQTLPVGWKTRTLYWTDREKHFYQSPEGKVFSSRKSVLEFMEQCGTYSESDFDKVRKGIKKKRKKNDNDQWVPVKKKQRKKPIKTSVSNQTNLVTEIETNEVEDEDEVIDSVDSSSDDNEDNTSDEKQASIKPCTVRIAKLE